MKKYLNFAFAYAVLAMAGGVFYREFTKWNAFTGATALGKVHTHLFILGMFLFLIVALFAGRGDGGAFSNLSAPSCISTTWGSRSRRS